MDSFTLTRLGDWSGLDEKSSLRLYQKVHMKGGVQIDVGPEVLQDMSTEWGITVDLDKTVPVDSTFVLAVLEQELAATEESFEVSREITLKRKRVLLTLSIEIMDERDKATPLPSAPVHATAA